MTEPVSTNNIDDKGYEVGYLGSAIRARMKRDNKRFWAGDNISEYVHFTDFDHLVDEGRMETYRITRCKMGFRSIADMPEWMIIMEFKDMGQMDSAFKRVAPLKGDLETKHRSFNQFVSGNIQHALFRDWPDQF